MRSLLIAPADEQRLAEALISGADAIIVDLVCAAPADRIAARAIAARFFKETRPRSGGAPALIVRTGDLDSGEIDSDLDAVMAHAPYAILLPGSVGAHSVQQLSAKLAVREADLSLADGSTRIIAVADTARSLFAMGSYRGSSARLCAIAWSAESLRSDIGAESGHDRRGDSAGPFRLARDLTLLAAASAGVGAIDSPFADPRDADGLCAEALAARRDGFAGKMAIDPAQAAIINDVFPRRLCGERSAPGEGAASGQAH
jgi:citrate lyase subunit beta / citryl-CoA lyase